MAKKVKSTRKPISKKSTALARRPKTSLARRPKQELVDFAPKAEMGLQSALASLPDAPIMLGSFVGKLKLTGDQIKALRRPVERDEIEWKPAERDGPPIIPYLSHNGYRDRLDAAFGLGGWGMVPVGMPKEKDGIVILPCALMIDGVPRAFAWGAQAYKQNGNMDWGDCLEGARSNAIVRCGKELGIARELWSKSYIRQLRPPGARTVPSRQRDGQRQAPPAYSDGEGDMLISDAQRKRLFAITRSAGRSNEEVKAWLGVAYNLDSTKKITRRDYEDICEAIEKPGPLPAPRELTVEREPGEDDE
jgi:hypothetical protein